MKAAIKIFRGSAMLLLTALTGFIIYFNAALPDNYYVSAGKELTLTNFICVDSRAVLPKNYPLSGDEDQGARTASMSCCQEAKGKGTSQRQSMLSLFGIFPIKNVTVTEVDAPLVVPCGNPFGIKMTTAGVMVVELAGFDNGTDLVSPAKDAGISVGDLIVSISGKKVTSNKDISRVISESGGQTLGVKIIRGDESKVLFLKPELSAEDDCYHAGMWVRDSSAGIGTVTFYDPASGVFAGLGHPVCDCDTGEILTMAEGQSADVYISGVRKSSSGSPGELIGAFISNENSGTLELNCEAGLYGYMDSIPSDNSAVEAAMRQEIEIGKASIYTTINGTRPEEYEIYIEKINLTGNGGGQDMVIKVTDEALLESAGGIVQGMSGSPIIQNGKLVGAVTHVFVSDPRKGYAIFADTMIDYAEHVAEYKDAADTEQQSLSLPDAG
ncbi:MAG: SpoIVB peptidase [Huintestinicola sp.]